VCVARHQENGYGDDGVEEEDYDAVWPENIAWNVLYPPLIHVLLLMLLSLLTVLIERKALLWLFAHRAFDCGKKEFPGALQGQVQIGGAGACSVGKGKDQGR
jgi:hypothetical protein